MPQGLGRFIKSSEGSKNYEYIGEFKDGLRDGELGKCFFNDGSFYAGSWSKDLMDTSN